MIKVLSLVATCMAVISFSGFAAEAPSTAAANSYEQNVVRLSKITVAPEYLDQYKAFAAEVGRESMKREPGVRVLYSMQEKRTRPGLPFSKSMQIKRPTNNIFRRLTSGSTRKEHCIW